MLFAPEEDLIDFKVAHKYRKNIVGAEKCADSTFYDEANYFNKTVLKRSLIAIMFHFFPCVCHAFIIR